MYVARAPVFVGIGLLLIPAGFVLSALEAVVLGGFGLVGIEKTGESAGAPAFLVVAVGTTLTLLGFALVQAAATTVLRHVDEGKQIGPLEADRLVLGKLRPLVGGLVFAVAVCVVLAATWLLLPVAVWLAVRWSLLAQVVEFEDRPALRSLRRSGELVRGRWFHVATLVGLGALLTVGAGPLLGVLLIFATDAPLPLLNVVAGVVYALAMPFVSLVTAYVYLDARVKLELEPDDDAQLPAQIELARATD
jgi:hypothetical protein